MGAKDAGTVLFDPFYDGYNEIRLLKIQPGKPEDFICCTLTHYVLHFVEGDHLPGKSDSLVGPQAPDYVALSYAWGPANDNHEIIVNGSLFRVRANLFEFLKQMRSEGREDEFWIDALCINQGDDNEKSIQVSKMRWIYKNANFVIAWLGYTVANCGPFMDYAVEYEIRVDHDEASLEEIFDGLVHISSRGYWERAWILQELDASYNILFVCGDRSVRGSEMYGALKSVWENSSEAIGKRWSIIRNNELSAEKLADRSLTLANFPDLQRMYSVMEVANRQTAFGRGAPQLTLRELIIEHEPTLCENPRDKVYSLLGFAWDGEQYFVPGWVSDKHPLKPNYGKSVAQVAWDVLTYCEPAGSEDRLAEVLLRSMGLHLEHMERAGISLDAEYWPGMTLRKARDSYCEREI